MCYVNMQTHYMGCAAIASSLRRWYWDVSLKDCSCVWLENLVKEIDDGLQKMAYVLQQSTASGTEPVQTAHLRTIALLVDWYNATKPGISLLMPSLEFPPGSPAQ